MELLINTVYDHVVCFVYLSVFSCDYSEHEKRNVNSIIERVLWKYRDRIISYMEQQLYNNEFRREWYGGRWGFGDPEVALAPMAGDKQRRIG